MSAKITLKSKALKSIERRHPWIFSGAIQSIKGNPEDGDILKLLTPSGDFAGRGYYNSQSQITVRILSWDGDTLINADFWRQRLQRAIGQRTDKTVCRLVHAESDYLPGLIVDRYGDWVVLQALTLGIDRRKTMIAEQLADLLSIRGVYERSDVDVRRKEGLPPSTGVLWGDAPPDQIEIEENGLKYRVDIQTGQKTGFYLDQSENRTRFAARLAQMEAPQSLRVLDTFAYTGGFTLPAHLAGIEEVVSVDASREALDTLAHNLEINQMPVRHDLLVKGDVFDVLRHYRDHSDLFDVIVLDPPKFASSSRQLERATRGYKDINLLAFQLLRPGGMLWTFSCSNAMSDDLFQKVVFGAMLDAGRDGQILQRLHAAADHPVALTFPEGTYLKGLVCRVW